MTMKLEREVTLLMWVYSQSIKLDVIKIKFESYQNQVSLKHFLLEWIVLQWKITAEPYGVPYRNLISYETEVLTFFPIKAHL